MRNVRMLGLGIAAGVALVGAVVGCTSDPPTAVGDSLTTIRVDTVLAPLRVDRIERHTRIAVRQSDIVRNEGTTLNPDWRTYRAHVFADALYLGEQEGTASAILVNYDFSAENLVFPVDTMGVQDVTVDNIDTPVLRLHMLKYYRGLPRPDGSGAVGLRKFYEVYRLLEPFDPEAAWPDSIPPHEAARLNATLEPDAGESFTVLIELEKSDFVDWVQAGERVGFLIQEGPPTGPVDPGMVGFSSRDNKLAATTIGEPITGRFVGPALNTRFVAQDTAWSIDSYHDVSTFHRIAETPTPDQGITIRTHVRDYPALYFDLGAVPANAVINRAILVLHADSTSFGSSQRLVVSELDTLEFGGGRREIQESDFAGVVDYSPTATDLVDPLVLRRLDFVVTTSVQRYVNGVYADVGSGVRGLLLNAAEAYNEVAVGTPYHARFWFSEYKFYGTAAADSSLRPRLEITYSVGDELGEAGND